VYFNKVSHIFNAYFNHILILKILQVDLINAVLKSTRESFSVESESTAFVDFVAASKVAEKSIFRMVE